VDARRWREQGCRLGRALLSVEFGQQLEGEGRSDEAYAAYRQACSLEASNCSVMADIIEQSGAREPKLLQELADLRARGCEKVSYECERYAPLYRQGLRARSATAWDWSSTAIQSCEAPEKGKARENCYSAAAAYALGIGVPRDAAKAHKLFKLECARRRASVPNAPCTYPNAWE
jgi:TPR repeat protein